MKGEYLLGTKHQDFGPLGARANQVHEDLERQSK